MTENHLHPSENPALEPIRQAIRSTPGYPFGVASDSFTERYVSGLKECDTADKLRDFVNAWKSLWTINFRNPGETSKEEKSLVEGTWDVEAVFAAMSDIREDSTKTKDEMERLMAESIPHITAANIAMPRGHLEAHMVAEHFGVPSNVAWIQLAGLVELF